MWCVAAQTNNTDEHIIGEGCHCLILKFVRQSWVLVVQKCSDGCEQFPTSYVV